MLDSKLSLKAPGLVLFVLQTYQIPTMQNGPDLAKRFYKDLTDIQVRVLLLRGFSVSLTSTHRFLLCLLSAPLSTDARRATGRRWLFKLTVAPVTSTVLTRGSSPRDQLPSSCFSRHPEEMEASRPSAFFCFF